MDREFTLEDKEALLEHARREYPDWTEEELEEAIERFAESAEYCEKCKAFYAIVNQCPQCTGVLATLEMHNSSISYN